MTKPELERMTMPKHIRDRMRELTSKIAEEMQPESTEERQMYKDLITIGSITMYKIAAERERKLKKIIQKLEYWVPVDWELELDPQAVSQFREDSKFIDDLLKELELE